MLVKDTDLTVLLDLTACHQLDTVFALTLALIQQQSSKQVRLIGWDCGVCFDLEHVTHVCPCAHSPRSQIRERRYCIHTTAATHEVVIQPAISSACAAHNLTVRCPALVVYTANTRFMRQVIAPDSVNIVILQGVYKPYRFPHVHHVLTLDKSLLWTATGTVEPDIIGRYPAVKPVDYTMNTTGAYVGECHICNEEGQVLGLCLLNNYDVTVDSCCVTCGMSRMCAGVDFYHRPLKLYLPALDFRVNPSFYCYLKRNGLRYILHKLSTAALTRWGQPLTKILRYLIDQLGPRCYHITNVHTYLTNGHVSRYEQYLLQLDKHQVYGPVITGLQSQYLRHKFFAVSYLTATNQLPSSVVQSVLTQLYVEHLIVDSKTLLKSHTHHVPFATRRGPSLTHCCCGLKFHNEGHRRSHLISVYGALYPNAHSTHFNLHQTIIRVHTKHPTAPEMELVALIIDRLRRTTAQYSQLYNPQLQATVLWTLRSYTRLLD